MSELHILAIILGSAWLTLRALVYRARQRPPPKTQPTHVQKLQKSRRQPRLKK